MKRKVVGSIFKSIKAEFKFILNISILTIFTIIIGIIGYSGINNIKRASDGIAKIRLPSIQSLQVINEAQTAMMIGERGLINRRMMSRELRSAQYEYIDNARKRSVEAWKIYELLPQTDKEAELWKDFIPDWNKWIEDNEKVIKLSREKDRLYLSGVKLNDPKIIEIDSKAFEVSILSRQSFFRAKNILVRMIDENIKVAQEESKYEDSVFIFSKSLLIVSIIIAIILSIITGFLIVKSFNNKSLKE